MLDAYAWVNVQTTKVAADLTARALGAGRVNDALQGAANVVRDLETAVGPTTFAVMSSAISFAVSNVVPDLVLGEGTLDQSTGDIVDLVRDTLVAPVEFLNRAADLESLQPVVGEPDTMQIDNLAYQSASLDSLDDQLAQEQEKEAARQEAAKIEMLNKHEQEQDELDAEQEQERQGTNESLEQMRKDYEERHAQDTQEQAQQASEEFAKAEQEIRDQQAAGHERETIELEKQQMAEVDTLEQGRAEHEQAEQARQAAERAAQEAAERETPER